MPGAVLHRKGSSGNDIVDVWVVTEGAPPSVKDTEEAWEIASDKTVVFGEFSDCIRRGREQGGVGQPLIGADHRADLLRNGKGEHEVMSRQMALNLSFQPLPCLMMLTGGTVTIPASLIDYMGLCTVLTLEDCDAG